MVKPPDEIEPGVTPAELDRRRARTPIQIGRILAAAYGHTIHPVVYTQGVALSGRLRLAELDTESPSPIHEISNLVAHLADPAAAFRDAADVGVPENFAALVWGDELARAAGDPRFADLLVEAAGRYTPRGPGEAPAPASPDFRTEDVFFAGAVLGRGFALSGARSRMDILANLILDSRIQQQNGLFWHSRSAPFHWGRGNGFAALGMSETLTYMPKDHQARDPILEMLTRQMTALKNMQAPSGMLRQVIDFPNSYQEFTATCMVGCALARGLRLGWLDTSLRETLNRAWRGVSERVDDNGGVLGACAGTGPGDSLRYYLDRPALDGLDDRSGGMALWFAIEIERLRRTPAPSPNR